MRNSRQAVALVLLGMLLVLAGCGQGSQPAPAKDPAKPAAPAAPAPAPAAPAAQAPAPAAPAPAAPPAGQKLKIGIVTFLSGPAAGPFGVPARNAAELLVEQFNAGTGPAPYTKKGINGVPVQVVYIDEAGGAEKQVAELRRLALDEKVDLVIGYISSADCLAIAPVAEELKLPTVLFDCGTHQIFEEKPYKYVFRTSGHQVLDSVGAARYVADMKKTLQTFGGINQNYAWGQDSWNAFKASILQLKPEAKVAAEQFPKLYAGEYSAEISALLAARPEVIHTSFWGGDIESFLIQSTPRGLYRDRILVGVSAETVLPRLGASMPEGIVVGARGPHGPLAPNNALNKWFTENYSARYNIRPVYSAYHMAQAVMGVKAAYEKAGAEGQLVDKDKFIAAFERLEFDTPSGMIKMALGAGHQAVEPTAYGITGKFNPATREVDLLNVKVYPAECVNPPDGVKSEDWIKGGFQGARC